MDTVATNATTKSQKYFFILPYTTPFKLRLISASRISVYALQPIDTTVATPFLIGKDTRASNYNSKGKNWATGQQPT